MDPSDSSVTEASPTAPDHATRLEVATDADERNATPVQRCLSIMDTKVFNAARQGDIDSLREHKDHLLQMLTPTKNTVLHIYIACIGDTKLTELLKPAEIVRNVRKMLDTKLTKSGLKPAEIVKEMLEISERLLLQKNDSDDTALHLAARHGRADIVGVLIQAAKDWRGGDIEEGTSSTGVCSRLLISKLNKEKNTALHEAVRFDHADVVKILIAEDPGFLYAANDVGGTPVYMAAERGHHKSVFEILDVGTSPSYQGPDDLTALHVAAAFGYKEITERLLLEEKTLAITTDRTGNTPLHLAALWGHVSTVKQIFECDKTPAYTVNIYGLTPVHLAAVSGSVAVLKQFVFYCPDSFELVDPKGRNALHLAIINNANKVEKFVRKDPWLSAVLLNSKDSLGNTPLHQIATSQEYKGLEFIKDYRVDKMAVNKERMNALDIIFANVVQKEKEKHISLHETTLYWAVRLFQGLTKSGAKLGQRPPREFLDGSRIQIKKNDESILKEIKESHMLVSTLIATVTFAAGFTMPGGYQSEKGTDQGLAVLSRNAAFQAFVITNTLAMSMSSVAVLIRFFLLLRGRENNFKHRPYRAALSFTVWALIAMVVAFVTGTYAVLGGHSSLGLAIASSVIGCFFFFVMWVFLFVPAFATLWGCAAKIIHCITGFLWRILHCEFPKCK